MELVKMIRNNVIRMVPIDAVAQREAEGYKKESEEPQTPSNPPANNEDGKLGTGEGEGSQTPGEKFTEEELKEKSINDLRKIAKDSGIAGFMNMSKETLVGIIVASQE